MPAPVVAGAVLLGGLLLAAYLEARKKRPAAAGGGGVLPAYPNLVKASPAQRQAALDAATAIGANPAALATVIQSESGWDPTEPHEKKGYPRAGLNQLTLAAKLPGFDGPDKIWAIRSWSMERQLKEVVTPYMMRFTKRADWPTMSQTALGIYKLNFLPGVADEADDYQLGVKDSDEKLPGGLKKGDVYAENPGFDPGHKGYFTWADVAARVAQVEKEAKGQVVDVAGNVRSVSAGSV